MTIVVDVAPERVPVVAVLGRPNVGKSSLVNRIVGKRVAIVEESPGVTRDRKALEAEWRGRHFVLVDTGGWLGGGDRLPRLVSAQAERAAREADLLVLVVDATVGVTEEDLAVAQLLRRTSKPVLVVANKVDSGSQEADAWAVAGLGLGDPWMVSALHGRGTGELLDEVVSALARAGAYETLSATDAGGDRDRRADLAAVGVVGRPNVGKSTLFNRLVGDERSITHEEPGTTRDSVDTVVETSEGVFRFIDTAGMRRRSRVDEPTEYYSLVRSLQSVDRADVVLLVVDATAGVTHQDQRLAERIDASGSPVVIVLNKWELLDADDRARVATDVDDRLGFLGYAPVVKVSARTGLGTHRILPSVARAIEAYRSRVPTSELNRVIREVQAAHPAPGARILYAVQGAADPPTFTLFTNRPLPPTYLRYIERSLRERLSLGPTPIKLRVRRRTRS